MYLSHDGVQSKRRTNSRQRRTWRIEPLEARQMLAASPIITELMADNDTTLLDGNGAASDWIELFNAGDEAIDLAGWHLTDNFDNLDQWTFPSVVLDAGEYLVVFASGDGVPDPLGNLHANFRLSATGEYVALVEPDGTTVVSEFGPGGTDFPPQKQDVSYGPAQDAQQTTLIAAGDAADVLIPADDSLGTTWTGVGFTPDGSWINGPTGIGYSGDAGPFVPQTVLQVDFNDRDTAGNTQTDFDAFTIGGTGIQTSATQTFGAIDVTLTDAGGGGFDDRVRADPTDSGLFTEGLLLQDFIFSRDETGTNGFDVAIDGLDSNQAYTVTLWSFDTGSNGTRVSDWTANGVTAVTDYTFDGGDVDATTPPASNGVYQFQVTVAADLSGTITLRGRRDTASVDTNNQDSFGVFLNALQIETAQSVPATPVLQLDLNEPTSAETGAADTELGFQTMTLDENGATLNGVTVTLSALGGAVLDSRDRTAPVDNPPDFTLDQIYDDFVFANGTFDGAAMQVLLEGLTPGGVYEVTLWSYDDSSPGTRRSVWEEISGTTPVIIQDGYTFDGSVTPTANDANAMRATLTASPTGTLLIQGTRSGGTSHGVFLNALQLSIPGFGALIQTDVEAEMKDTNASAFVRVPFTVPADAELDIVTLGMQYDAGFVAYLNGQEIARRNAPTPEEVPPAFNAAATEERTDAQAAVVESINITSSSGLLNLGGSNVLAIHGLNSAAGDDDFLILPTLSFTDIDAQAAVFFTTPTPGGPNGQGFMGFVGDTHFSVDRGHYQTPFDVEITTDTPDADIYYTIDGSVPDASNPNATLYTTPVHVDSTTMLRAIGFKDDFQPTDVDTQTYIFLEEVIQQDPLAPQVSVNNVEITTANTVGTVSGLADWNFATVNGTSDTLWVPRETFGTFDRTWQSLSADVPQITVTIGGLNIGESYNIFVNYWDADETNDWRVMAGLAPGAMTQFDSSNGIFTGEVSGNRQLYNGFVGTTVADGLGEISLYLDDVPPNDSFSRTFLDSVGYTQGDPPTGPEFVYPTVWQAGATADFEMDPEIVAQWDDDNPLNEDFGIREALRSLPTMSIVMNHDDLWNASSGIYPDATRRGPAWRKPGSVEYFDPDTGEQFQVNAGIQMHGNASRDNVRLKKHSFRLVFKDEFDGPAELDYPIFADSDIEQINTLVLRATFTDSFATRTATGRYSPLDSQYFRDVWVRDTQLAMGHPSAHSTWVHLYINGLYWGIYNPAERPDDAFLAEYLGGEREDWDVIKDFNELFRGNKTAWNDMFALARQLPGAADPDAIYQQLQGNDPDGTPNAALPVYLDMDNLIDYMVLHLYAGAEDWPHHNWYAGRNRVDPGTGFKFMVWDQEIVLDGRYRDRTESADANSPAELFNLLRNSDEFRLHVADRVQLQMFNDGPMSTTANQARWMTRANEIEAGIIAESARWGDAREGEVVTVDSGQPAETIPTMTVDMWRTERDNVHDNYFPTSHDLTIQRFQADGLWPTVAPVEFNQHGGVVPVDFAVTMTSASQVVMVETELVSDTAAVTALVPVDASLDGSPPLWTAAAFDDSAWLSGNGGVGYERGTGYDSLLGIDLLDPLLPASSRIDTDEPADGTNENNSIFVRYEFDLDAGFTPGDFEGMLLRMKYDDGFVAYLNGTIIEAQLEPDPLAWNSTADGSHEASVGSFDQFDVTQHLNLLLPGQTNVLAIHGLNTALTSSDMIILPELVVTDEQTVASAPIYYTTNGADPRLLGGGVHPDATLFTSDLILSETTTVRARAEAGGQWSAVTGATFVVNPATSANLVISEIDYNPAPPTFAELEQNSALDNDDFEFVELMNISDATIHLGGIEFGPGDPAVFSFDSAAVLNLDAGETALVVKNLDAFRLRYGTGLDDKIVGVFTEGGLSNGGESVTLLAADGEVIRSFSYNDNAPWPSTADGLGFSLVLKDPASNPDHANPYNWRASAAVGGSPGVVDPPGPAGIVINEALSNSDGALLDTIELFNPTGGGVNIGGWFLTDDENQPQKYQIADPTVIPAGGYLTFDETQFNAVGDPSAFALSATGDEVFLFSANPATSNLTGYVHGFAFGAAANNVAFIRHVDSTGYEHFTAQTDPGTSLGGVNEPFRAGEVVITELHYNPKTADPLEPFVDEFIEIQNISGTAVPLFDPDNPANTWVVNGAAFAFPPAASLAPGEVALVVAIDPETFRTTYSLPAELQIFGPFLGSLSDGGETVSLQRPTAPSPEAPLIVPLVDVDVVRYDDDSPWTTLPDGGNGDGSSLTRLAPDNFGSEPLSWTGAEPTPGAAFTIRQVVGRQLFYNDSDYDAVDDADAIATDKTPLLPGESATRANYSNYQHGINGLIVDLLNPTVEPTPGDFAFRVGNVDDTDSWQPAPPTASFDVDTGGGAFGSTRVTITWANSAIAGEWLETTIAASLTGTADTFYYGSAIGETGNDASNALVTAADLIAIRNNPRGDGNRADITNPHDIDRDRLVDATDALLARNAVTGPFDALRLITPTLPPTAPPEAEGEAPGGTGCLPASTQLVFGNEFDTTGGQAARATPARSATPIVLDAALSELLSRDLW